MKLPRAIQDVRTIEALLTGAEAEARRAGDDLPGPEHLLLSAFGLPDGTARRAFERLGADPEDFRAAVDTAHRQALHDVGVTVPNDAEQHLPPPAPPGGVYRMTAPGQEVFQAAVKLSKAAKPLAPARRTRGRRGLRPGTRHRRSRAGSPRHRAGRAGCRRGRGARQPLTAPSVRPPGRRGIHGAVTYCPHPGASESDSRYLQSGHEHRQRRAGPAPSAWS